MRVPLSLQDETRSRSRTPRRRVEDATDPLSEVIPEEEASSAALDDLGAGLVPTLAEELRELEQQAAEGAAQQWDENPSDITWWLDDLRAFKLTAKNGNADEASGGPRAVTLDLPLVGTGTDIYILKVRCSVPGVSLRIASGSGDLPVSPFGQTRPAVWTFFLFDPIAFSMPDQHHSHGSRSWAYVRPPACRQDAEPEVVRLAQSVLAHRFWLIGRAHPVGSGSSAGPSSSPMEFLPDSCYKSRTVF